MWIAHRSTNFPNEVYGVAQAILSKSVRMSCWQHREEAVEIGISERCETASHRPPPELAIVDGRVRQSTFLRRSDFLMKTVSYHPERGSRPQVRKETIRS